MPVADLSRHIISYANENYGGISNLKLQKVLYFVIVGHIKKKQGIDDFVKSIYNEPFEAWQYGPVIKRLYFKYRKHYYLNIIEDSEKTSTYSNIFDCFIEKHIEKTASELVEESRKHDKWQENKEKILSRGHTNWSNRVYYTLDNLKIPQFTDRRLLNERKQISINQPWGRCRDS